MHFMSTLYYTTFLDFLRTQDMTYFENSVLFSTQLFWSPIVTEMYCMIADWGGGGRWCYMHFMSTLYYATFLDFCAHNT